MWVRQIPNSTVDIGYTYKGMFLLDLYLAAIQVEHVASIHTRKPSLILRVEIHTALSNGYTGVWAAWTEGCIRMTRYTPHLCVLEHYKVAHPDPGLQSNSYV